MVLQGLSRYMENKRNWLVFPLALVVYVIALMKAIDSYTSSGLLTLRDSSDLDIKTLLVRNEDNLNVPLHPLKKYLAHGADEIYNEVTDSENSAFTSDQQGGQNQSIRYQYHPRGGDTEYGIPFNVDVSKWMGLHGLPLRHFAEPSLEALNDLVFVTGATSNHVEESTDAVASVQKYFPGRKIWYFDWGLSLVERRRIETWCNVELREFNFNAYPVQKDMPHSARARYQTAKVFAMIQALHDYQTVIWMDASVRFLSGDLQPVYDKALHNSGLVFFVTHKFCRTFEMTHPKTFEYLPTNMTASMRNRHAETSVFLIMRTVKIYHSILWWLYMCSLERDCIAPILELLCDFARQEGNWMDRDPNGSEYQHCHRMEQSALNILAGNMCNFDVHCYAINYKDRMKLVDVERQETSYYELQYC